MADQRLSRISSRADTRDLSHSGEKRHTVYYMNVEVGHNKYYLHKRYTEFLMLHHKLCEQQYPEVEDFDFPPKVWFNTFSEQVIEYRRTKFEHYVSLLMSLSVRYPGIKKELELFLGVPRQIDPKKKYAKTPKPSNFSFQSQHAFGGEDGATPGRMSSSSTSSAYSLLTESTPRTKVNMAFLIYAYVCIVALLALWGALDPGQARTSANAILVVTGATLFYGYRTTARSLARLKRP